MKKNKTKLILTYLKKNYGLEFETEYEDECCYMYYEYDKNLDKNLWIYFYVETFEVEVRSEDGSNLIEYNIGKTKEGIYYDIDEKETLKWLEDSIADLDFYPDWFRSKKRDYVFNQLEIL